MKNLTLNELMNEKPVENFKREYGFRYFVTEDEKRNQRTQVNDEWSVLGREWSLVWDENMVERMLHTSIYRRRITSGSPDWEIVPEGEFQTDDMEYTQDAVTWIPNVKGFEYNSFHRCKCYAGVLAFRRRISKPVEQPAVDPIAQAVAQMVLDRSAVGVKKYGVGLSRTDLTPLQWLQHLQEELLDAAGYVESLKRQTPPLPTAEPEKSDVEIGEIIRKLKIDAPAMWDAFVGPLYAKLEQLALKGGDENENVSKKNPSVVSNAPKQQPAEVGAILDSVKIMTRLAGSLSTALRKQFEVQLINIQTQCQPQPEPQQAQVCECGHSSVVHLAQGTDRETCMGLNCSCSKFTPKQTVREVTLPAERSIETAQIYEEIRAIVMFHGMGEIGFVNTVAPRLEKLELNAQLDALNTQHPRSDGLERLENVLKDQPKLNVQRHTDGYSIRDYGTVKLHVGKSLSLALEAYEQAQKGNKV